MWPPFGAPVEALLDAVTGWLAGAAADAINTVWDLLTATLLMVPDVTQLPQVHTFNARTLAIVNACFVLAIVAVGVAVMGHNTVQIRYGIGELAPRLVVAFVAANFATPICKSAIEVANALTQAITGQDIATDDSLAQMRRVVQGSLSNPAITLFTVIISLLLVGLLVTILVGWITRIGLLIILVGGAPLALACHATPWTDPVARLWWRALFGNLGTVGAQGAVLQVTAQVYFDQASNIDRDVLGLPSDPPEVLNLAVVVCALWATAKIPALMRRYVTGGRGGNNLLGAFVRLVVVQQVTRAVTGGLLGGRTLTRGGGGAGSGRSAANTIIPYWRPRLPRPTPANHPPAAASRTTATASRSTGARAGAGTSTSSGQPTQRGRSRVPAGVTPATVMPKARPAWQGRTTTTTATAPSGPRLPAGVNPATAMPRTRPPWVLPVWQGGTTTPRTPVSRTVPGRVPGGVTPQTAMPRTRPPWTRRSP
jgi:hypothetical protein